MLIDELERVCTEQNITYERLFKNLKCPLAYRINLSNMKELDHLRQRHLIIGNRSILDVLQITWMEHRDQAIILGYLLKTSLNQQKSWPSIQQLTIEKSSILL